MEAGSRRIPSEKGEEERIKTQTSLSTEGKLTLFLLIKQFLERLPVRK